MKNDFLNCLVQDIAQRIKTTFKEAYLKVEWLDLDLSEYDREQGYGFTIKGMPYGKWTSNEDGTLFCPELLTYSNYSGSLVEKSNLQAFTEQFKAGDGEWWTELWGGHWITGVVIDIERLAETVKHDPEMLETVNDFVGFFVGLANYPLADEDLHSQLEIEAQNAAWDDWGREDFVRALEKRFSSDDPEVEDPVIPEGKDQEVDDLFYEVSERICEYWRNEQGDQMYIDVDKVAAKVTPEEFQNLIK